MDNESSLLAYLVPRLTSRGEDTATDALAFILNKSEACRRDLESLMTDQGFSVGPLTRFQTQVTYEDGSRPDMVGYDREDTVRLVVESKFWAALLARQASVYFDKLDDTRSGILLFIAPATRVEALWAEIRRQMEADPEQVRLESVATGERMCSAGVAHSENGLILVSWDLLLDRLVAAVPADSQAASDIRQLGGFARAQDSDVLQPIQREDLSPSLARNILGINELVDRVVNRGVENDWMSVDHWHPTRFRTGSGRTFQFVEDSGARKSDYFYLGTAFDTGAAKGSTPLWLTTWAKTPATLQLREASHRLEVFEDPGALHIPIHLKVGVEYHHVLDDVVEQLRRIAEIVVA